MKNKNFLIPLLFIPILTFSQDKFRFPIYPGCEKLKTNEELEKCFSDKLWEDLRKTKNFTELENEVDSKLTLYFTIMKNMKISMFSYAKGSNPELSTKYLERIQNILDNYTTEGLYIRPAMTNGKYENYRYILKVNPFER